MKAEISSQTDISSKDFFETQSANSRSQMTSLKTRENKLNSKVCLLEPLQEQVYNTRAPVFQARGARSVFTEGGRVSTDVGLVTLEEEINSFSSALEWKQRFQEIYGIEYDGIASEKIPGRVVETLNFRADFQLLPRYRDTSSVTTTLCDTMVMMWWSADGRALTT